MEYCHCGKPATTVDQLFGSICEDCKNKYIEEFEKKYPIYVCEGCGNKDRIRYINGLCFTCALNLE